MGDLSCREWLRGLAMAINTCQHWASPWRLPATGPSLPCSHPCAVCVYCKLMPTWVPSHRLDQCPYVWPIAQVWWHCSPLRCSPSWHTTGRVPQRRQLLFPSWNPRSQGHCCLFLTCVISSDVFLWVLAPIVSFLFPTRIPILLDYGPTDRWRHSTRTSQFTGQTWLLMAALGFNIEILEDVV